MKRSKSGDSKKIKEFKEYKALSIVSFTGDSFFSILYVPDSSLAI